MDTTTNIVPPEPKCARLSIERLLVVEQHMNSSPSKLEARAKNRWLPMPNELVFELCQHIQAAKTTDRILLTAVNVHAYLESRYRKKLIYCHAIAFLKEKLNNRKEGEVVPIQINRLAQTDESEHAVIQQQWKWDDSYFVLETNQLLIQISGVEENSGRNNVCSIPGYEFENVHVQHFVYLIVPLIQPITLDVAEYSAVVVPRILNSLQGRICSLKLEARQLLSEPICEAVAKYDKLHIDYWALGSGAQRQQFRWTFIQWLSASNNPNRPKLCCIFWQSESEMQELLVLLAEIKEDFCRAISRSSFAVRICYQDQNSADEGILFNLRNILVGEQLELRRESDGFMDYICIRCPAGEDTDKYVDLLDFDCTPPMATIRS